MHPNSLLPTQEPAAFALESKFADVESMQPRRSKMHDAPSSIVLVES
jgi:hypothetical protein|tara:strand:- start:424 stop:564 length:141 start_codon:yes stop_codon:yes gene_type:complete